MRKAGELAMQERGRPKASDERMLILADLMGPRAWQRAADCRSVVRLI
jgi:hypothetical protein